MPLSLNEIRDNTLIKECSPVTINGLYSSGEYFSPYFPKFEK